MVQREIVDGAIEPAAGLADLTTYTVALKAFVDTTNLRSPGFIGWS